MLKYLSRFTAIIGVIAIIAFSSLSIFLSILTRDVASNRLKNSLSYASFFENRFFDFRIHNLENRFPKSDKIALVKIDDESLQKIGVWPIPRSNWSKLLEKLKESEARVVVFDIMFPEQSILENDQKFKEAIISFQEDKNKKVIFPYAIQSEASEDVFQDLPEDLYNFILDSKQTSETSFSESFVEKYTYPYVTFLEATPDLGYISMNEDSDGVFRHYKLAANFGGILLPSIGLKAYTSFTNESPLLEISQDGHGKLKLKESYLALNSKGESKIRWIGSDDKFEEVSLWKILEDDSNYKDILKDKIIFVASTATGAHDLRNTPIDSKLPGVYAHINLVSMLLNEYFYKSIDASIGFSFLILMTALFVLILVMNFKKAIIDLAALVSIIILIYYLDSIYFLPNGYELKLFFTLFALISTYSWLTFLNFNQVSQEKKQIRGAFSRYVAEAVIHEMLSHPDKLKIGGEKKEITCLFSDVRDFTSISEKLSPTELGKVLNLYMGKMTDIVFETQGTLDKYIGDAIVAFWGAPIDQEDHAQKAVDAAYTMIEAMPKLNKEFKEKNYPEFKIGIGLNSGECSVGNMGSDQIFAYTALGDNMNLGARLESLCKHYGAMILISEYTYKKIDSKKYKIRLIDKVAVKGKTTAVEVYEVLPSFHFMQQDEYYGLFRKAYDLFLTKDFKHARECVEIILKEYPDRPSELLLKKCIDYIENPPKDDVDHAITIMYEK